MKGINGADTAFMIFAVASVMLMTPALSLFYGGMVRKKNVLSTTMHSYAAMAIVSIQWILIGYTLCFGTDIGGFIGNLKFLGLDGVGFAANPEYAATIPHQLFMLFQLMFAIITPALISGAIAERMKFIPFVIFILLWTTLVYDPVAHWVWGIGGWIRELGALDFAGGNVIHITSGISGLVLALMLGKRKDMGEVTPHSLPMTVLGAGLLWFGWFGFNAGSALGINHITLNAFITTNTSAAAGAIAWSLCELHERKKITSLGIVSGVIAGLVSITPGAGFVTPLSAILIGLSGGAICFFSVTVMKKKFKYDDALDAFGCHGVGGIWGGIVTGIFASKAVNPDGADGLIYGNINLLGVQIFSIVVTIAFAAIMTFIIVKLISMFMKIRVSNEEEHVGLDVSEHEEEAYGSISA